MSKIVIMLYVRMWCSVIQHGSHDQLVKCGDRVFCYFKTEAKEDKFVKTCLVRCLFETMR